MTSPALSKRVKLARQYHFVSGGVLYVAVTTLLMLGALNSQNNLLFAALGIAMAGLVVSGVMSGAALLGVRVERVSVSAAGVGRPMTIRYTVRNVNRVVPAFALIVEEVHTKSSTWNRHLSQPRAFVAHVGPGQEVECEAVVWPSTRGTPVFDAVRVWSSFPFGIAKKSVTQRTRWDRTVVRPLVLPMRDAMLERPSGSTEAGLRSSRRPGGGDEFFGLREFVPGDQLRHIAWRATARTGKVLVTQSASPVPDRLWVILRLDASRESREPNERAIALAASIATRAGRNATMVGLEAPLVGLSIPPGAGCRAVDRLLDALGRLSLSATVGGSGSVVSTAVGPRDNAIVVHAGEVDSAFGPRHARHISSDEIEQWVSDKDTIQLLKQLAGGQPAATRPVVLARRFEAWAAALLTGNQERVA